MKPDARGSRRPATEFIVFLPSEKCASQAQIERVRTGMAARFPRFSFLYRSGSFIGEDENVTVIPVIGSAGGPDSVLHAHPSVETLSEIADEVQGMISIPLH